MCERAIASDQQAMEDSDNEEDNSSKETPKEGSGKMGTNMQGVNSKVTETFGPWMLAKRTFYRSNMNQGVQGSKEGKRNGNEKAIVVVGDNHGGGRRIIRNSKFAIWDLEGEENLNTNLNVEDGGSFAHQGKLQEKEKETCQCTSA